MREITADGLSNERVSEYCRDGVVLIRQAFRTWTPLLQRAVEQHLVAPGPNASEHVTGDGQGRFFEEYLSWQRIPEYKTFIFHSTIGALAATLMQSKRCQLFADHVFVKEPGTSKRTPWHQDAPYSPFEGVQSINAWIALDKMEAKDCLVFVPGSHLWELELPPRSFDSGETYQGATGDDPDKLAIPSYNTVSWCMEPGDSLFFDSRTLHGTMEAGPLSSRRRAFCVRMVGDDIRYSDKAAIPPFPWSGLKAGECLPEEHFPTLFGSTREIRP